MLKVSIFNSCLDDVIYFSLIFKGVFWCPLSHWNSIWGDIQFIDSLHIWLAEPISLTWWVLSIAWVSSSKVNFTNAFNSLIDFTIYALGLVQKAIW